MVNRFVIFQKFSAFDGGNECCTNYYKIFLKKECFIVFLRLRNRQKLSTVDSMYQIFMENIVEIKIFGSPQTESLERINIGNVICRSHHRQI